jgi:hypothetical protein
LLPFAAEVRPNPLALRSFIRLLYQPWMTDEDEGDDYADDCGANDEINDWHKY